MRGTVVVLILAAVAAAGPVEIKGRAARAAVKRIAETEPDPRLKNWAEYLLK